MEIDLGAPTNQLQTSLYVTNLPDGCKPGQLAELFAPYGLVTGKITVRKKSGLLYGFLPMEFTDVAAADKCVEAMRESSGICVEPSKAPSDEIDQKRVLEKVEVQMLQQKAQAAAQDYAHDRETERKEEEYEKKRRIEPPSRATVPSWSEKKPLMKKKKKTPIPESKKVRLRQVADVAKSTSWDAVLGHKWEDKHENTFSLLGALQVPEVEPAAVEARYELVASQHFFKRTNPETIDNAKRAVANPNLKRFERMLNTHEGTTLAQTGTSTTLSLSSSALGMGTDAGSMFMRDPDEMRKIVQEWKTERADNRKDFKRKKQKNDRNQRSLQSRKK